MKDVLPCARNSLPWQVEVKTILERLCGSSMLMVAAKITENFSATLYVEHSDPKVRKYGGCAVLVCMYVCIYFFDDAGTY